MNDDYLWNKTGDDPEIRHLEAVLSVFRYQEIPAPVKAESVGYRVGRWTFAFPLAFAGGLAVLIIAGVLFLIRPDAGLKPSGEVGTVDSDPLPVSGPASSVFGVTGSDRPNVAGRKNETPRRLRTKLVGAGRVRHERKISALQTVAKSATPTLTKDEKYAYDQLMLALSITGSKLRIVRDAIQGTGDEEGTRASARK